MRGRYLLLLVVAILASSEGQNSGDNEEEGSVLTSFLKTISSSNKSPTCPGRCFNALAALACREVVDKPGVCRNPGYRCCKNSSSKDEAPEKLSAEEKKNGEKVSSGEVITSTDVNALKEKNINLELKVDDKEEFGSDREAEEKSDSDSDLLQYSPPTSVKVCPGVCVAQRISNFCEAAIDVQGLCKPQLRCCVPANLFSGVDNVPDEFIILNSAGDKQSSDESRSEMTDSPISSTASTTTSTTTEKVTQKPKTKPTTIKTTITTTRRTTTEETTTKKPRDKVIKSPEKIDEETSFDVDNDGIPSERKCKGTCVAGFFAFLCDAIDRSGDCPRGGRCCVTQKRPKPDGRPRPDEDNGEKTGNKGENNKRKKPPQQSTTPKPKRRPNTTPEPYPEIPSTERPNKPLPCRGTCLPVSVASRCQSPSRLVVASGCREDEICCDDRGKKKQPTKDPSLSMPGSGLPPSLGTLLSLFGGGSGGGSQKENNPPRRTMPPRPTTTTTTTTTPPPTTTEAIIIPDCPGTCISPILSFTCFGNAEMTDLFKCKKDKQSCCAPKSAIREMNRQNEMNSIARNDTVYTPQFNPYGQPYGQPPFNPPPFDHSQYPQNPYEQPNFIHQNYPQHHDETNYPAPFYNQGSLQPPPPPHLHAPHHQQPTYEHPPPPFQEPTYKTTQTEHTFPPYHQQSPEQLASGAQQSHYPYQPENNAPYYQQGPTYEQNQSARYPYPSDTTTDIPAVTTIIVPSTEVANKYVCGIKGTNRAARVVGGEDSVPGEWCWQVALINSLNQYLCGGALIGTQWVLTAAHCVTNIVRSGDAIYVRVGDHDLTTRFGSPGAQTIPVATTYIHHNHNSQTLDNDIALLKLSSHAELGNGVCLVCLPARGVSQVAGKRCTVTGYGYMGETGPIPLRVREAEIPVVSDNECVRKINAVTEKIFILPASSFCAGGESGHDACQGDGGGPLVCNVDNYYELSGLVSWGFGCGRQDVPGVYVKVSSFIGWVNQIISVNNT